MTKLLSQIFRKAGVSARVSKDPKNPKFKVCQGQLTLEGVIKNNKYTMKIKDTTGRQIDTIEVAVSNENDIINRISESLNTFGMLANNYENIKLVEDDEEYDLVDVDEEPAGTLEDGLNDLYNSILDVAEQADGLLSLASDNDAEQKSIIIGFSSALYDTAIDVDDYHDELTETDDDEDDVNESVQRVNKSDIKKALDSLTMAESLVRKKSGYSDVYKAIKDVKTELIKRGLGK